MKKIILIGIFVLLLSTFVLSENAFIFHQNRDASLIISCFDSNNTLCNDSVNCFITVIKPNSDILLDNASMTYSGTYFNYSLAGNDTEDLGKYSAIVMCKGSSNGFSTFNYLVTPSGTEATISQSIMYIILILIAITLLTLSTVGYFKIDTSQEINSEGIVKINAKKYIKIGLFFISYILLIWISNLAWTISQNFLFLNFLTEFFRISFFILIYLFFPMFILTIYMVIFHFVTDKKIRDLAKRGLGER